MYKFNMIKNIVNIVDTYGNWYRFDNIKITLTILHLHVKHCYSSVSLYVTLISSSECHQMRWSRPDATEKLGSYTVIQYKA